MSAIKPNDSDGLFIININSVPLLNNSALPYKIIHEHTETIIPLPIHGLCPLAQRTFLELRDANLNHKPPLPYVLACVQYEDTTTFFDGPSLVNWLAKQSTNSTTEKTAKKIHLFIQRATDIPFSHLLSCDGKLTTEVLDAGLAFSPEPNQNVRMAQYNFICRARREELFLEDVASLDEYILSQHPYDILAEISLGLLLKSGARGVPKNTKRAKELLKNALQLAPGNVQALCGLGQIYLHGGEGVRPKAQKAQIYLEQALEINENLVPALLSLSELYRTGGEGVEKNIPQANDLLSRAMRLEPYNISTRLALIRLLKKECSSIDDRVRADLLIAVTTIMNPQQVQAFCQKEAIAAESHATYRKFMANKWHTYQFDKEIAWLAERILIQEPDDTISLTLLGELLRIGKVIPKNWHRACELFWHSLSISPNYALTLSSFAAILRTGGNGVDRNADMAKRMCEKALDLDPKNAEAFANLGMIYRTGIEGRLPQDCQMAARLFLKALDADPNNLLALEQLGELCMHGANGIAQDCPKALELFERALKIDYENCYLLLHFGILLKKGGYKIAKDEVRANILLTKAYSIDKTAVRDLCQKESVELPPGCKEKVEIEEKSPKK